MPVSIILQNKIEVVLLEMITSLYLVKKLAVTSLSKKDHSYFFHVGGEDRVPEPGHGHSNSSPSLSF